MNARVRVSQVDPLGPRVAELTESLATTERQLQTQTLAANRANARVQALEEQIRHDSIARVRAVSCVCLLFAQTRRFSNVWLVLCVCGARRPLSKIG